MKCRKCERLIEDDSIFCRFCGVKQEIEYKKHHRGKGEGYIQKLQNGKYKLILTEYVHGERKIKTKTFRTKAEAQAYVPTLKNEEKVEYITFKGAYDLFIAQHKASKSTIDCYRSAFRYFSPVEDDIINNISVDDLQECLDDCPKGKRTKQNMKAICGLIYKYAIPRYPTMRNINLAEYLRINDDSVSSYRESFTDYQLAQIKEAIGRVPYADYIYIHCYLGFRPSAFVQLKTSDYKDRAFIGGIKTDAGKNRIVTVSPKVLPYVDSIISKNNQYFVSENGNKLTAEMYRDRFYKALELIGIDNPTDENGRKKYSPHTCRHTFTTLMKRVPMNIASEKDRLELIGHTDYSMTMSYMDVSIDDLRKITDAL